MISILARITLTIVLGAVTVTGCVDSEDRHRGYEMAEGDATSETTHEASKAADEVDLDGMSFAVMTNEKGKEKADPDTLVFADGTFESIACRQWGFSSASYTKASSDDGTTFSSTTHSDKEGTLEWTGTVSDGSISGTYVWKKEGQDNIEYEFTGTSL